MARGRRLNPGNRAYLEQVVETASDLLRATDDEVDQAIDTALSRFGRLTGVDRTYVFRFSGPERMDNTHEWVAPGVTSVRAMMQGIPTSLLAQWTTTLAAGEPFAINDLDELPGDSPGRRLLEDQSVRSLAIAPMLTRGQVSGFVGLDATRRRRHFTPLELQLIQVLGNAVGVLMDRAAAGVSARNATRALEAKQRKLQATLNALPYMVVEIDGAGRYVSHNTMTDPTGYLAPDLFMGKRVDEVLPSDLLSALNDALARIDEGAETVSVDYQIAIEGQGRWHNCILVPRTIDGRRDGVYAIVRDFTEQHRQQFEIARLGEVARLTSNLVILADADTGIEWVNPAFERRTGWQLDEIRGRRPRDMLRSVNADAEALGEIDRAINEGRPVQAEVLNRTRDGTDFWMTMDTRPIFDAKGKVQGYLSVQTEITHIKQSHSRELHDWQMAIDAASDGVAMLTRDGQYQFMNRTYRDMFAIGPSVAAESLHWFDLHPDVRLPWLQVSPLQGSAATVARQVVWRGRRRDGAMVQQELSVTPREAGNVLVIARDISSRIATETERTALRDALQLANQRATIAQIAAFVAHDLNNAIAVVSGASTTLQLRLQSDPESLAKLNQIRRATAMASDLVADLKRLGRPGGAAQRHDLRDLVTRGVDLIGLARIDRHGVEITQPDVEQPVHGVATRFLQVVVNLVLNACESNPSGPARVRVAVLEATQWRPTRDPDVGHWQEGRRHAVFSVSDDGSGIASDLRPRLFEPYFTTKGSGGTGLGLPIVATILNDDGGALWLDAGPGGGTVVTVAWPAEGQAQPAEPAMAGQPPAVPLPGPDALAGCTVMVVDDIGDVADATAEIFERAGALAVSLTDPQDALELLTESPGSWTALVTDFAMPGLTGADLARAAARLSPPVPTLILTGQPERVLTVQSAAIAVLAKPVADADLIGSLAAMLRRSPATVA